MIQQEVCLKQKQADKSTLPVIFRLPVIFMPFLNGNYRSYLVRIL